MTTTVRRSESMHHPHHHQHPHHQTQTQHRRPPSTATGMQASASGLSLSSSEDTIVAIADTDAGTTGRAQIPKRAATVIAASTEQLQQQQKQQRVGQPPQLVRSKSTIGVTFAPLPQVGQRKRKSRVPLGVAGRAELMRRRRPGCAEGDEGVASDVDGVSGGRRMGGTTEDDLDLVILAMGRFFKDTGKHLWRRVSSGGRKGSGKSGSGGGDREEEGGEKDGDGDDGRDRKSIGDEVLGGMKEREESVREVVFIENENGVQVQFPQDLSQTETVGRGYAWRTVSIVAAKTEESGSGTGV